MGLKFGAPPLFGQGLGFVASFITFLALVKEFSRYVKFWPSYSELNLARFFGTQCIHMYSSFNHVVLERDVNTQFMS